MTLRIEEVTSTTKSERVATHTHIKGLGLTTEGVAVSPAAGRSARFEYVLYSLQIAIHLESWTLVSVTQTS